MVRAILEGRKTQTRRVVKWKPREDGLNLSASSLETGYYMTGQPDSGWVLRSRGGNTCWNDRTYPIHCPYGSLGSRLWVREQLVRPDGDPWLYTADKQPVMVDVADETAMIVWAHHKMQDHCPSIHMPRWASRITLEITDVRVQRVQEISEEDARAEGCDFDDGEPPPGHDEANRPTALIEFRGLWDTINGKTFPWSANPWVFALTFRRLS